MNGYFNTKDFRIEYIERTVTSTIVCEQHCHPYYEMVTLLEGDISMLIEGKSYHLPPNHTIIHPPHLYHSVLANSHCKYRRVNAFFDLTAVPAPLRESFRQAAQNIIIFKSNRALELEHLCCWGSPSYYLYHEAHVQSLMNLVFYQYVEESASALNTEMTNRQIQDILRYIDDHIYKKITLPDIMAHTRRSQSALVHSFKKNMGISIKQYILQKKMALAHQKIQEGIPMTTVALQFGYDNYSVFYRAYRNYLHSNVPDISEDS